VSFASRVVATSCWNARRSGDRAHGIVNHRDDGFGIASGTERLTALTIMSLVRRGSLTLDTPVRSVLGDVLS